MLAPIANLPQRAAAPGGNLISLRPGPDGDGLCWAIPLADVPGVEAMETASGASARAGSGTR